MDGDRERWNAKWRERAGELEGPAVFVAENADRLPARGRALDVAGGAGRNAIWLARRGLDVTLVDVSDVALDRAEARATALGIAERMRFVRADLDADTLTLAPVFDVIVIIDYLNRARRDAIAGLLAPEGVLVATQPTVHNLTRHAHPSRQYCVESEELVTWARDLGLAVEVWREDWNDSGRHVAELVARRVARTEDLPREPIDGSQGPYR
jgi:tellurite methyltransferase